MSIMVQNSTGTKIKLYCKPCWIGLSPLYKQACVLCKVRLFCRGKRYDRKAFMVKSQPLPSDSFLFVSRKPNHFRHHLSLSSGVWHASNVRSLNFPAMEFREIEERGTARRRWEDMDIDILVKIFHSLTVFELTSGIAHVCSTWRMAACDPFLWKTLDLSMLKSNYIKIPLEPYVYVHGHSDKTLTRFLKISLSLSRGNITSLFFHCNLYVSEYQLTYTAQRCPRLKRLVLPAWNRVETVMIKAIDLWKDLESLTMPSIVNPPRLVQAIATNCRNFSELKIMGPFDIFFASSLVNYLPTLKVLSLRCSMLYKDTLIFILDNLCGLEVLNISHCLLIEVPPPPATGRIVRQLDKTILEKASHLLYFITCMSDTCIMCQRTRNDEGLMRWYKYNEGLWKEDEVSSLAL